MIEYITRHETFFLVLTAVSVITFAGTLIAVTWLIVQMPDDYFSHPTRRRMPPEKNRYLPKVFIIIAKNVLGIFFIGAGFIMLFIPGQGLLTIVIGLILLDFPGKYTVERWVVSRGPVWRSINRIRKRWNRPPLDL